MYEQYMASWGRRARMAIFLSYSRSDEHVIKQLVRDSRPWIKPVWFRPRTYRWGGLVGQDLRVNTDVRCLRLQGYPIRGAAF